MKLYKVIYKRKTTAHYWTYASEIIEARGLMHVQKLANDHLKELRKLEPLPLRIDTSKEMIKNDAD